MFKNLKVRIDNFIDRVDYKTDCAIRTCKNSDCNVPGFHLHKYTNGDLTRFMVSERLRKNGYDWTSKTYPLEEKDRKLAKFIQRKKLLLIDYNKAYLKRLMKSNQDFVEYEYEYDEWWMCGTIGMWKTKYDWTSDPNHSDLTGEVRQGHYRYQGYKIINNKIGGYKLVKSPLVDNIMLVKDEYPYFKVEDENIRYTELPKVKKK